MIDVKQVLVSTHDRYHAWYRVSPISRDFCQGWQRVAVQFRSDHSSSRWLLHFCHHSFLDPFAWLFIILAMCIRAVFSKSASILGLAEQAFWRMPFFTEWIGASSFEVILARPSPLGLLPLGLRVLDAFHILLRRRSWRRVRLCQFCTLIDIVTETASVSFRTLPVGFPLPTISNNSFVHAVLSPDSWPRRFFHNFQFWLQNS